MATSIRRSIDILVLIWTLGHDLYRVGLQSTGFKPNLDLLTYLDGNVSNSGPDDPHLQVTTFHLPWWTGSEIPSCETSYLSFMTICRALIVHYDQVNEFDTINLPSHPAVNKPPYKWHQSIRSADSPDCSKCRLYQAVPLGALESLHDIQNIVHAHEMANQAERDVAMWRASGFRQLFETVLQKELMAMSIFDPGSGPKPNIVPKQRKSTPQTAQPQMIDLTDGSIVPDCIVPPGTKEGTSGTNHTSATGTGDPLKSLKRDLKAIMMAMAGPSKKWTWGVELDIMDLQGMVRGIDRGSELSHSGYDTELGSASISSTFSDYMQQPYVSPRESKFDNVSSDVISIRSLRPHEFPIAFRLPPLHHLSTCDTDSEPDSAIKVFEQMAVLKAKRKVMQAKIELPDSFVEGEDNISLPVLPFLFQSSGIAPDGQTHATESHLRNSGQDIQMDDLPPIPIELLGSPSTSSSIISVSSSPLGPLLSMIPVMSNSEDNSDIYTDDSGGPPAVIFNPDLDDDIYAIPINIPKLDSSEEDDQPALTAPPCAVNGRDPITGLYTASSFAHLQDDFFE